MAGIRLFGRRFNFSSDDLSMPALIDILLRIPLLILVIIYSMKDKSSPSRCSSSFYIGYFYPLITVYIMITIVSSLIGVMSLEGTPVNNIRPRRHMSMLIYIRLVLVLLDFVMNLHGLWMIIREFDQCDALIRGTMIGSIVISCSAVIALFILLAFLIDLTGMISAEKKWEMRLKFLFCCGRNYGKEKKLID